MSLRARLPAHVRIEAQATGEIVAFFDGYGASLGRYSEETARAAERLHLGVTVSSPASAKHGPDDETERLMRRLAWRGLLEFSLKASRDGADLVVIGPHMQDYWPQIPQLDNADVLVLSRFAYLRRRGNDIVLESPRAGALFKICDPQLAASLALLSTPQSVKALRRQEASGAMALFALLVACHIIVKVDAEAKSDRRAGEGDDSLALWDFHDFLFHARSTQGRHANPLGGTYPHAGVIAPVPALRPPWQGQKIDLNDVSAAQVTAPVAKLLRQRRSTRSFDDRNPITRAELARCLDGAARVLSMSKNEPGLDDGGHAVRPYPSAGAAYELELYVTVETCEGLARGFYHYDAGAHAMVAIDVEKPDLEAQLMGAQYAMGATALPQILITIAARFGRMSWKYSSIAYALILKDAGVLTQTLYLMATDMGLGGCAIGIANIELFAKMTGIDVHVEGPVGLFAIGRAL